MGQWTEDKNTLLQRRRAIFEYDQEHKYKASHQNEFVKELYDKYLGKVGGERAHELMHTHYKDKTTENSDEFKCKVN